MKFHNLRDFIAVARMGGVRPAARDLGLSQPSLTKSIRQLERELGMPLFDRTAKGAVLNAFGHSFLVRAQLAANELKRGEDELHQMAGSSGGSVAAAVSGLPCLQLLPGALRVFRRRYPQARVRIVEGVYAVMLSELRTNALDFALAPQPTRPLGGEFVVESLFQDRCVVVGRKGHPLRGAKSLAELLDAEWVVTGEAGPQSIEFDAAFENNGLRVPQANLQCESLIALLSIIANSDLLVFLPQKWLGNRVTDGLLAEIPVREHIDTPAICLIRREGLPLTPAAEALVNALTLEAQHRKNQRAGKNAR